MNNQQSSHTHPVLQLIRNFINRLKQNPEVYPIKYYKKNSRYRKDYKQMAEK